MTPSEGWWVLKAQAGDRDALEQLLRGIHAPLLRFVTRMTGDRTAEEDILQDTLLVIARKLQWLDRPDAFRRKVRCRRQATSACLVKTSARWQMLVP